MIREETASPASPFSRASSTEPAELQQRLAGTGDKQGRLTAGVDLGGTNLRIAAFDSEWKRLDSINLPTRVGEGPEAVVGDMCDAIRRVLERCGANQELIGVGIGAPGPLELPSGRFHRPPNLPGFDGFLLKDAMESNLQTAVIVECDANAAALAEWKSGAGKEMPGDSMCMLTLGTGVGAGIILERKIWHGMNGMGGEGGHIPVVEDGFACGCGGRGCLEQYTSATAICRAANRAAALGNAPRIVELIARRIESQGEFLQTRRRLVLRRNLCMQPGRKLISGESVRGYVCDVCGWVWPTSSFFIGNSPEQAMLLAFDAHDCSNYPPPHPRPPVMKPE